MSHEITIDAQGRARAVYAKEPAWHRLGTVLEDCFSSEDAIHVLDPEHEPVKKWIACAKDPITGEIVETEDQVAIVKKMDGQNVVFSYQAPSYGIVQLEDQFSWMDQIVSSVDGAHYTAAVLLRKGRQCALTIDLGAVTLDPQERADINHKFLFGANSWDGSWALKAKLANLRGECANMAAMILRGHSPEYSTRHTTNIMDRIAFAKQALGLAVQYNDLFYATAEQLIHTPMTDNQFKRILDTIFVLEDTGTGEKDEDAIAAVRGVYELNPTQMRLHGTMWGGFNAVTYYNDWMTAVRGGRSSNVNEMRFLRQFDDTKGIKQKAWDVFCEIAEVG